MCVSTHDIAYSPQWLVFSHVLPFSSAIKTLPFHRLVLRTISLAYPLPAHGLPMQRPKHMADKNPCRQSQGTHLPTVCLHSPAVCAAGLVAPNGREGGHEKILGVRNLFMVWPEEMKLRSGGFPLPFQRPALFHFLVSSPVNGRGGQCSNYCINVAIWFWDLPKGSSFLKKLIFFPLANI